MLAVEAPFNLVEVFDPVGAAALGNVAFCDVLSSTISITVATTVPDVTTLATIVWSSTVVVLPMKRVSLLGSTTPTPDAVAAWKVTT